MIAKMENLGCKESVVGLVIPLAIRSTWTEPASI